MSDKGKKDDSPSRAAVIAAVIGGVSVIVAAVVTGVLGLMNHDKTPTASGSTPIPAPATAAPPLTATPTAATTTAEPAPVGSPSVRLSATNNGDGKVDVSAVLTGRPAAGEELWFVLELHNVNGHSEYYPRRKIITDANQSFSLDVPSYVDVGQKRTAFVYDVTDRATQTRLAAGAANNDGISATDLVKIPCKDCTVSNEVTLPFGK